MITKKMMIRESKKKNVPYKGKTKTQLEKDMKRKGLMYQVTYKLKNGKQKTKWVMPVSKK